MSCPKGSEIPIGNFGKEVGNITDKLGMSETCKKAAQSAGGWVAASAGVNTPFGSAGAQTSAGAFNRKTKEAGCSQSFLNLSKLYQLQETLNCNLVKNNSSNNMSSSNINQIEYTTLPLTTEEIKKKAELEAELVKADAELLKALPQLTTELQINTMKLLIKSRKESLKTLIKTYDRSMNFNNVNINQSINQTVKLDVKLSAVAKENIASIQNSIAEVAVAHKIENDLGVDASTPNIKSAIVSQQNSINKFNSVSVNETIQKVSAKMGAGNILRFTTPGQINMENVNIDQNITSKVVASFLYGNAISKGVEIAQTIVNKTISDVSSKTKSKGTEALIDAMGEANAKAIKAAVPPYTGGIIGIVIFIVIFGGLFMYFKNNPILKYLIPLFIIGLIIFIIWFVIKKKKNDKK